ncbi:uncharacterized protein EV420DRAFT_539803 [Desarmillaria tabescens]|uniref:Uncharacterized protein n=1 Tax=Armillaria tabescens TaxID=1929756 RepID=A0AA39K9R9_ARMTA|nr:uncharacterized protein EV420DRAFT_539803 [Desarmillaria tabescens]KAK0457105.1 hypothetical protein EV420DRAFT_539803 [Desarmillaria tabescens]
MCTHYHISVVCAFLFGILYSCVKVALVLSFAYRSNYTHWLHSSRRLLRFCYRFMDHSLAPQARALYGEPDRGNGFASHAFFQLNTVCFDYLDSRINAYFISNSVRRNFADRGLSFYLNDDPKRQRLIEDLPQFFHFRRLIQDQHQPYLIKKIYSHFGTKPIS